MHNHTHRSLFILTLSVAAILVISGCTNNSSLQATLSESASWTEGHPGSFQLASDGTPPYACSVTKGALPPWLTLNGCVLSGTAPILQGSVEGISPPFTIEVTDSASPVGNITFETSVTIRKAPLALTLNEVTCFVRKSCNANLIATVTGGEPPYHYQADTLANGAPPWGTSIGIDGTLIGIPTLEGQYTFGVCVVDSGASSKCGSTAATIEPAQAYMLSVSLSGAGDGTVYADPFDSGAGYESGTEVTLTAAADDSSVFAEWSGDCTGQSCVLEMDSDKNVVANFDLKPQETTYSGPFNFRGTYSRPFPDWGTTCTFDDTFSGTIDMLLAEDGNLVGGTVYIYGTFTSNAISGSTANFECLSSQSSMDDIVDVSGTKSSLQFSTSFVTAGGSIYTGVFSGSLGAAVTGTITESSPCCSGSSSGSVTLTKSG